MDPLDKALAASETILYRPSPRPPLHGVQACYRTCTARYSGKVAFICGLYKDPDLSLIHARGPLVHASRKRTISPFRLGQTHESQLTISHGMIYKPSRETCELLGTTPCADESVPLLSLLFAFCGGLAFHPSQNTEIPRTCNRNSD